MEKIIRLFSLVFTLLVTGYVEAENEIVTSPISYSSNFMQMIVGLLFIVLMIFGVVWLMKKIGYKGYGSSELIKIKSCLPLSTKEKLFLIEIGEEQILIGMAPGFIGHLKTIENPVLRSNDVKISTSTSIFSEKLKMILSKESQNKKEIIE
jgi:flagellar protein FliO/FliZ